MGCFQVQFYTTRNDFFHKIMITEKSFLQGHNDIAESKVIYKFKNDKP